MIEQVSDRLTNQNLLLERCYDLIHHGGACGAKEKLLDDLVKALR